MTQHQANWHFCIKCSNMQFNNGAPGVALESQQDTELASARKLSVLDRAERGRTTAMKQHNRPSDDRPIQYRGRHSRQSRGQALTNHALDRHTGATCLKPSRRTIEAPPLPVSLFSS
jgi:hypothetical protein